MKNDLLMRCILISSENCRRLRSQCIIIIIEFIDRHIASSRDRHLISATPVNNVKLELTIHVTEISLVFLIEILWKNET